MGKYLFLLVIAISTFTGLHAQNVPPADGAPDNGDDIPTMPPVTKEEDDDAVFTVVEVLPEFPGGPAKLMVFLASVQYPNEALKAKQQGTVYISIAIEKDGSISNVEVARTSGFEMLDAAALKHVLTMPNWKPGYQAGKPVRVKYVLPVKFML